MPSSVVPVPVETLLTIDVENHDDRVVLRARGEVDLLTAGLLRTTLATWLRPGARPVVADLRGVSFVACAGVGALAEARHLATRCSVTFEVVPGAAVARLAALLDLAEVLDPPGR